MFQYYFKLSWRECLKGPLVLVRVLMGGEWLAGKAREEFRRWQRKELVSVVWGRQIKLPTPNIFHIWHNHSWFECERAILHKDVSIFPSTLPPHAGCLSRSRKNHSCSVIASESFNIVTLHFEIRIPRTKSLCNTLTWHYLCAFVCNLTSNISEMGVRSMHSE